jgi:putative Holliday junction resolvase
MRVFMCLDLGEKRIGLATGSLETCLASPVGHIDHKSRKIDIEKIQALFDQYSVNEVILGISYQENGTPNSMGKHALSFGEDLQKSTGIPVRYWDETLSTRDAKDIRLETGANRKNRQGHQDALAAALILQSFFDNQLQEGDL